MKTVHHSHADLLLLRQFAARVGVIDVTETASGVRGILHHGGQVFAVALDVLPSGSVEMVALTGPDAGDRGEVSSMDELRAGLAAFDVAPEAA